ncbi:hypothetical protein AA313_de0207583 [Arthrobotrys entomopaga]|nr:hypothetical protein AA313_de0207583 [Arthrobotrys entomopaga]
MSSNTTRPVRNPSLATLRDHPRPEFTFKVEMGFTARPRLNGVERSRHLLPRSGYNRSDLKWRLVAEIMRNAIYSESRGLVARVTEPDDTDREMWNIVTDGSIVADPGFFKFELVTKVYKENCENWPKDIQWVWKRILEYFEVRVNKSCGTYVHFAAGDPADWSLTQLRNIPKAIIIFDPLIDSILEEERRKSRWTKCVINSY